MQNASKFADLLQNPLTIHHHAVHFFQQTNDVQYKESGADICKYICKYYTSVFWQDYQRKTL